MEDRRETVRARHAAELEAKRKKLEEIRRRKANIRTGEEGVATESVARAIDEQENKFDDFIQNILKTTATGESESEGASATTTTTTSGSAHAVFSLAEKLAALSTVGNVAEVHIQPTLVETYTKFTETDITLEHEIVVRDYQSVTDAAMDESSPHSPRNRRQSTDAPSTSPSGKLRSLTIETDLSLGGDVSMGLSDEEKKKIMQSDAMESFLLKASRVIERAMTSSSKFDIMVDYGATVEEDHLPEESAESLKQLFTFKDDQWTKHRAVTDVDTSPFYPELMLVSYTSRDFLEEEEKDLLASTKQWDTMANSAALADLSRTTEGVVMLWSTALPTRPEYRFTCHSQVTSACFNPFDRNIIFGGTYSGQIVVWDTRAKSAPVQKTLLSSGSHTHPIYSMSVVGTKSAYHLVSASTDGRVCVWDVDQLQQPLEMLDLRIAMSIVSNYSSVNISSDKKMEASVTSFAIHRKENKQLYIGTEAGKLYSTPLDQQKSKAVTVGPDASGIDGDKAARGVIGVSNGNAAAREVVVNPFSKESAHFGPVTAIHMNPLLPVHRDGLLLTASLDSTVKLWSTEHPQRPVFSFEPSNEYVCDVRWSPLHPALFAVVDGSGMVGFWNVNKDVEVPVLESKVSEKALNKVRWTADGKNVIVGDASGQTIVYEVPSEISVPHADELSVLESKVASAVVAAGINRP
ncbi:hypothetical protein Poli38472_014348 [Pythium oligandrum]|uniref:Dynein intermediate chain n=1 Tax=Pythium oligandrum TaxID=41045 RepID=A0A8K1C793_PYTOL|nr:hypothetical protein Poli38472_014348 [Pythium oligandrum]|eukprot:TMW57745.1 hypothetical protein Poli38472_014348 [Pythium oligandrum]